jgi:hypothetical protein
MLSDTAALLILEARIKLFTSLPIASLDRLRLQEQVTSIGTLPAISPSQ